MVRIWVFLFDELEKNALTWPQDQQLRRFFKANSLDVFRYRTAVSVVCHDKKEVC